MTTGPRIASIPACAPFLATLVAACLDGSLGPRFDRDARDFSDAVIYVPTRRAARALAHAFADALQPRAVLLPRIVPLGDPNDLEEKAILGEASRFDGADGLPPAMGDLGRRLLLTSLVDRWRTSQGLRDLAAAGDGFTLGESFADSYALARELAGLIDEAAIEGADWSRLAAVADAGFDEFWRQTRTFLEIAGMAWPDALRRLGRLDAADRRNQLLRAEAARLRADPPQHPVIAAGSTGTVPATAELLAAIARMPQGAVVLPGLDTALDDAAWALVADDDGEAGGQPGHPQSALKRLLGRLGVSRSDVSELGVPDAALAARTAIVAAASLPAGVTERWSELRGSLADSLGPAMQDVAIIEANDEREEAAAIAVALRETLEDEGATAALITPDRALAERVSAELLRWGVRADDSAGAPLDRTPLAGLALLVLDAVREDVRPISVAALLANPCIAWTNAEPLPETRAALELAGFRGNDVASGLSGLARALDGAAERIDGRRAMPALKRVSPEALDAAQALLRQLIAALAPLAEAAQGPQTLADFARLHTEALEALAGDRASAGADGKALAALLDAFAVEGQATRLSFADYAAIFASETRAIMTPPAEPIQGRIKIWGLLEARLMHADRIVLGGLNEGAWPGQPPQDPFLNRAMRRAMGLALPERRIGQAAHDFAQGLGAPQAIISRARTVEGTPMVASRFLRRFDAFIGDDRAKALRQAGGRYVHAARSLDQGPMPARAERPNPKPAPALQPIGLSVTDVATLVRDPYALYARDILKLSPLDPLEAAPDASDRGTIIHDALARFVAASNQHWPDDPLALLLALGHEAFAPVMHVEAVAAFWWPMFESAAAWFVADRAARRGDVREALPERSGRLTFPLPDGALFTLRGRGDLIERMADGTLAVTDYKTGQPPGPDEVKSGNQPQLTLMAAMARAGQIDGVPAAEVSAIRYLKLGRDSYAREIKFKPDEAGLADTAARHLAELNIALARLRTGDDGFLSRRRPKLVRDGGPYDHLARVREWLASGDA